MHFEWDDDKASANERKHGVRFADAARVFADDWRITKGDDRHGYDEHRWVTIGMVGAATLLVVFAERGDSIRIISARKRGAMKEPSTTRITVDLDAPVDGGTDWERLAQLTDEEVTAAAESDPDCPPLTPEQLARMRRAPSARRARQSCGMTQKEFARTFGLSIGTVRDWEQHRFVPDRAARALLCIIERYPEQAKAAMRPASRPESDPPEHISDASDARDALPAGD